MVMVTLNSNLTYGGWRADWIGQRSPSYWPAASTFGVNAVNFEPIPNCNTLTGSSKRQGLMALDYHG